MKKTEHIALDLANGFIKVSNQETLCYENKLRRIKHNDFSVFNKTDETIYTFQDNQYVLDPVGGITSGGRNNLRYGTDQYLLECLIAISKVTDKVDISLTIGLPCKDYGNANIEKKIIEKLKGTHILKIKNRKTDSEENGRVIDIKDITILCEPVGTLLDLIIDEKLNIVSDLEDLKYLIIDIGHGTMDIIETNGLNIINKEQANIGGMTLVQEYLERINANHGDEGIVFKESDSTIIPKAKINKYKKEWDFSSELQNSRKYVANEVTSTISQKGFAYEDYDLVVFTGGCCLQLKDYLELPTNGVIHENCQNANVNGYRKYAQIMKG